MSDLSVWRDIVRKALEAAFASSGKPVLGTILKAQVDLLAGKQGLRFPPPDQPHLRFLALLKQFPEDIYVARAGPGKDILVVPANRLDILDKLGTPETFLRRDLFQAFTQIPSSHRPWYNRVRDAIEWRTSDPEVGDYVAIPPASSDEQIQIRRKFADTQDPTPRGRLQAILNDPEPGAAWFAFGNAVRDLGIQKEWHNYRSGLLRRAVQDWAKQHHVPVQESWFETGRLPSARRELPTSQHAASLHWLISLLQNLKEEDLARISIPLDLLIKARGPGE